MFSISRLVRMQVENTNYGTASKYRTRSHDLIQETWHFPNFTTNNRMNERSETLVNTWNTGSIVLIPSGINNPRGINRNMLDMQEVLCASVHRTNLSSLPARRWQMDRPFPRVQNLRGVGPRLTNVDRKLNDANNHYNTRPRRPVSTLPTFPRSPPPW